MNRVLIIACPNCERAREVLDPHRNSAEQLGDAVQRAALEEFDLRLGDGSVPIGCECRNKTTTESPSNDLKERGPFRFNLRQTILIVTTICVLLSIFRHPISMLADEQVLKAAAAPWSVYGWFFFGTEVIDPRGNKNPMVILMLLANVVLAILIPMGIALVGLEGFKSLWKLSSRDTTERG